MDKKRSLIDFQKKLTEQFRMTSDSDNSGNVKSPELNALDVNEFLEKNKDKNLGLIIKNKHFDVFVKLIDLKNVVSSVNVEYVYLTKPWLTGFLNFRGEIFTLINVDNLCLQKENTINNLSKNTQYLLIKEVESTNMTRIAFASDEASLTELENFKIIYQKDHKLNKLLFNTEIELSKVQNFNKEINFFFEENDELLMYLSEFIETILIKEDVKINENKVVLNLDIKGLVNYLNIINPF